MKRLISDEEAIDIAHFKEIYKAEKEGRLIILPCRVGDTIYKLWYKPCHKGNDYPDAMECEGCLDNCDLKRAAIPMKVNDKSKLFNILDYFGSFYFLTFDEAEKALKTLIK